MPASSAAVAICAQASERHDAVLHVEKQPVEPGRRHRLGDLDAAGHANADAERQMPCSSCSRATLRTTAGMAAPLYSALVQ